MTRRSDLKDISLLLHQAIDAPVADELNNYTKNVLHILADCIDQLSFHGSVEYTNIENVYEGLKLAKEAHYYESRNRVRVSYERRVINELKQASTFISKSIEEGFYWIPEWVAKAVQLYGEPDNAFASMKLRNFIKKMQPSPEEDAPLKKCKEKSDYKKRYPKPRTKAQARKQRGGDGFEHLWKRNRDTKLR